MATPENVEATSDSAETLSDSETTSEVVRNKKDRQGHNQGEAATMIPVGSLATHHRPPRTPSNKSAASDDKGSPSFMKAEQSQTPAHGSGARKTGWRLGSLAARDQQNLPAADPKGDAGKGSSATSSTSRQGLLEALSEGPPGTQGATPIKSRHRRGSSASSLAELGSSLRRRSTSLRGRGQRSPESSKLASLPTPRDTRSASAPPSRLSAADVPCSSFTRPSTATGDYKSQNALVGGGPATGNLASTFSRIQEQAAKRVSTLDYLKKAHEGRVYWYNTLFFRREDLAKLPYFEASKLPRRAANFFVLGVSIPTALDANSDNFTEYMRIFNALLTEFETYQSQHPVEGNASSGYSRRGLPTMFKRAASSGNQSKGRRPSDYGSNSGAGDSTDNLFSAGAVPGMSSDLGHNPEYNYLLTPFVGFDLDYYEVFPTLCDVLIDCYTTMSSSMTNPDAPSAQIIAEQFSRVDAKIKKLVITGIIRDFEAAAKAGIRSEFAGVGKVVLGGLC